MDTQLSVFRGNSPGALTRLASNDDDPLSSTPTTSSRVRFEAAAGTSYQISVNGFDGAWGACLLTVEPTTLPANRINTLSFSPSPADVTSQSRASRACGSKNPDFTRFFPTPFFPDPLPGRTGVPLHRKESRQTARQRLLPDTQPPVNRATGTIN
jgi:hypothetical protein